MKIGIHRMNSTALETNVRGARGGNRRLAGICLALLMTCAGLDFAATQAPAAESDTIEQIDRVIDAARDRVFPALVNIEVVVMNYWDGRERKGRAVGSGTIISTEGYVVTNNHVTWNGKKFKCTLADKQEIPAELIGEDPWTDLAVLKLDLSKVSDSSKPLPIGQFGDSDKLQIGDYVMAMGSPFALSRSVSLGIVSNTERVFTGVMGEDDPDEFELEPGQRTGLFNRWIQHDALINPGNSGGPLVNLRGEVVGVNTRGGGSMGFAIPANLVKVVAESLIKNKEVPRSWFGLSLKPIEKTGYKKGVLVNSVDEDGPSHKAGLQAGDVMLKINGDEITVRFPEEAPLVMKRMSDFSIGSSVKLTVQRGSEEKEIEVVTEKLQKDRGLESAFRGWGITCLEITDKMARELRYENKEGAYVSGVRQGGPAQVAEPSLAIGDVIKAVNGEKAANLARFIEIYDKIMGAKPLPETILIEYDRRGKSFVTVIKPKPEEEDDPPRELEKAWIGIATQPVLKTLAEKLGQGEKTGYRVTRIYPGTKAATSDLKVGDVITALNGNALKPKGMQDVGLLDRAVKKLNVDETAKLTILRAAEEKEISVALERTRLEPSEARRNQNKDFELNVREVTFFDRDENRWSEDESGVIVEGAESAGWAELGGIRPNDLIQKIGDYEIKDIESYREAMKKITEAQPERVVFVVLRGPRTYYQFVEPDWKPVVEKKGDEKK